LARAGDRTPVIFLIGHADIPMTVQAMKAGAVEFLTKPYRDRALLDAVLLAIEIAPDVKATRPLSGYASGLNLLRRVSDRSWLWLRLVSRTSKSPEQSALVTLPSGSTTAR
jgi:FixJ family two-component response regulator